MGKGRFEGTRRGGDRCHPEKRERKPFPGRGLYRGGRKGGTGYQGRRRGASGLGVVAYGIKAGGNEEDCWGATR